MITHRWEKRPVSSMSLDSSRWQSTTSSFSLSSLMYQCKQCLFFHVFLVFLFRFVFGCMINLQGFPSLHLPQCINVSNVYFSLFFSFSFFFLFVNHNLQRVPSLPHPEFITPQVICITQLSKLFPILSFQLSFFPIWVNTSPGSSYSILLTQTYFT